MNELDKYVGPGSACSQQLSWRLEETSTELVLASSLTNVAGPVCIFARWKECRSCMLSRRATRVDGMF